MEEIICKEVIVSRLSRRGKGVEGDPIRIVTQVFEKNGTLIAENDSERIYTREDLIHFGGWLGMGQVDSEKLNKWVEIYNK